MRPIACNLRLLIITTDRAAVERKRQRWSFPLVGTTEKHTRSYLNVSPHPLLLLVLCFSGFVCVLCFRLFFFVGICLLLIILCLFASFYFFFFCLICLVISLPAFVSLCSVYFVWLLLLLFLVFLIHNVITLSFTFDVFLFFCCRHH